METQKAIIEAMWAQAQASTVKKQTGKTLIIHSRTSSMPRYSQISKHLTKKETFRNYRQRLKNYLKIKHIFDNKEYCAQLLLNSIGATYFNTVTALAAPKTANELTYDELVKILENHLTS